MKLSFFLCVFLFPVFSESQLSHPLFLSQAGAGGASLKEDFSFLLNPAAITFQKKNKTILSYTLKKQKQRIFFSFADLKTQIPLAISYQRDWSISFTQSQKDTMFFSSGIPLSPYFSLGIAIEKDLKTALWNGSLGSFLKLGNQLSLALFLNDIFEKENKNKRSLSLAFYHNWKSFLQQK